MEPTYSYHLSPLGDAAVLITCGNIIDRELNMYIHAVADRLCDQNLFYDVVRAYTSLAVHYDIFRFRSSTKSAFENVVQLLHQIIPEVQTSKRSMRTIKVPVCYHTDFAFDLEQIASEKNISADEVVQIHSCKTYHVYMLGFLQGFAYMGDVDNDIAVARKSSPRQIIPAGSVGIAGLQTGIYPTDSPGGWNIIGRTPVQLFDSTADQPTYFQPGDQVRFIPITKDAYYSYQGRHS